MMWITVGKYNNNNVGIAWKKLGIGVEYIGIEEVDSVKNKSDDLIVSQSKHSLPGYLFMSKNK